MSNITETAMPPGYHHHDNWFDDLKFRIWVNHYVDLEADALFVAKWAVTLFCLRFIVAGAYNPKLRHLPCVCDYLFAWAGSRKEIEESVWIKARSKLNENFWYSCWHTSSFIYGCVVASNQDWMGPLLTNLDGGYLYSNWAAFGWPEDIGRWYTVQLAFWISTLAFLFLENQRSDFFEMFAHHLVTIFLLVSSYGQNQHRAGLMVAWIHDCADIFLYIAKWFQAIHKLMEKAKKTSGIVFNFFHGMTDIVFAIFALSFFVTRLVLYPYICVLPGLCCISCINYDWSPWYICGLPSDSVEGESPILVGSVQEHGEHAQQLDVTQVGHIPITSNLHMPPEKAEELANYYPEGAVMQDLYIAPMAVAMGLLLSLHAFWGSIIFKMVLKSIRDSTVTKEGDARSDSEDSDDSHAVDSEPHHVSSPRSSTKSSPKDKKQKSKKKD